MRDTLSAVQEKYWASDTTENAVGAAIERIKRYQEWSRQTGWLQNQMRSFNAYRGAGPRGDANGAQMLPGGESGALLNVTVNQYAGLVNQTVTLITTNKPATKAIAANNDFESLAQAQMADAIVEHYDREIGLSETETAAIKDSTLLGESAIVLNWDTQAGKQIGEGEQAVFEGDVEAFVLTPVDYAYDPDSRSKNRQWAAFRRPVNRWDLAAQYPSKAEEILAISKQAMSSVLDNEFNSRQFDYAINQSRGDTTDVDAVWVWELRHKPSSACPNGRLIRFLDDKCVLFDTIVDGPEGQKDFGFPFFDLCIKFVASERKPGTEQAHTPFFDLLSMQEGIDLASSIMASAINSGGLQNLYVPRGANITADRLTGSLNVIQYDGNQMPEAKDNVSISPVVQAWIEFQIRSMRQRIGSNDVASGEPSKGMPAQAMALLRASAVEFHSGMQLAYEQLIQWTRTGVLRMLQQYASNDRVALVAGKSNSWTLKYFTGQKLGAVDRFVVEPINPAMRTLAGKVGFAQPLLDTGRITIDEYLQLIATGRLEPILHAERDNYARIQQEKELLMKGIGLPPVAVDPMTGMPAVDGAGLPVFADAPGEFVRPLMSDTHWIDIPEYLGVLAMPNMRSVPKVVTAVTQVVDLKLRMWRAMPPDLIQLLKGPLPEMAMMAPPGAPGESTGGAGGPDVSGPRMPEPPKNPITGQQDQVTDIQPQA